MTGPHDRECGCRYAPGFPPRLCSYHDGYRAGVEAAIAIAEVAVVQREGRLVQDGTRECASVLSAVRLVRLKIRALLDADGEGEVAVQREAGSVRQSCASQDADQSATSSPPPRCPHCGWPYLDTHTEPPTEPERCPTCWSRDKRARWYDVFRQFHARERSNHICNPCDDAWHDANGDDDA